MTLPFFTPARRPADEAARQRAVDRSGVFDLIDDPALDDLVGRVAALFDTPMATLSIIDQDRQWFAARRGVGLRETTRAASFCGHTILQPDRALLIPDTLADGRFAGNPLVRGDPGLRFYIGQPLVTADGHALGALCALDRRPRPDRPDADTLARLGELSREAAGILQSRALRSAA